jgi:hypothetical protein
MNAKNAQKKTVDIFFVVAILCYVCSAMLCQLWRSSQPFSICNSNAWAPAKGSVQVEHEFLQGQGGRLTADREHERSQEGGDEMTHEKVGLENEKKK